MMRTTKIKVLNVDNIHCPESPRWDTQEGGELSFKNISMRNDPI